MKAFVALAIAMSATTAATAADEAAPAAAASAASAPADAAAPKAGVATPEDGNFCLYGALPSGGAKYTLGTHVKTSRETYGPVTTELPRFVATAKGGGADAVVNFNGAQHFGFWPWRLVRPVLTGVSIKWTDAAPDCEASGGKTFAQVLATNKEPPKK